MSQTSDQMELREAEIVAHYPMALALLQGFDHAPRIGKGAAAPAPERSSGIGTRRRFRTTTPGLVTRRTTPAGAVQVMATIEGADDNDALKSPVQATVLNALRRATLGQPNLAGQRILARRDTYRSSGRLCNDFFHGHFLVFGDTPKF